MAARNNYDRWDSTPWCPWAHRGHRRWAAMPECFWAYVYKARPCMRPRPHDWAACPFAHRGEGARRRDPLRVAYAGEPCPELHYGRRACASGPRCGFAHGPFELWLHPATFRTRLCVDGPRCPRALCFFAHSGAELRREGDPVPPPPELDGSVPLPPLPAVPRRIGEVVAAEAGVVANKVRLQRGSSSSSSCTPAGASATAPANVVVPATSAKASLDDDGEYSGCNSGRFSDEESILSDDDDYQFLGIVRA